MNFGHFNIAFGDYFCKKFLLTVLSTGILRFFIRSQSQDSRLKPFKIIREMNQNTRWQIVLGILVWRQL